MHVLCELCHVLLELLYTFEHIWTNLLTQCTQLPVVVFCYFCILGFPAIKSAPKIPEKSDKKAALRKLPEKSREGRGAPPGDQKGPWRGPTLGRARGPPGCLVGPPGAPLRLYLPLAEETPNTSPFSQSLLCTAATAVSRSGLPGEAAPAPCRKEEPPRETIHSHGRL